VRVCVGACERECVCAHARVYVQCDRIDILQNTATYFKTSRASVAQLVRARTVNP